MLKNIKCKRFGRLKVISRSENKGKDVYWKCKCDCGKICYIRSSSLINKRTKSCGCLHKDKVRKAPYYHLFSSLKRREKCGEDNKRCSFTFKDFIKFINIKNCHYCNSIIKWYEHKTSDGGHAYNLDRKDNTIGYDIENCVVCCPKCNRMKGSLTYNDFYNFTRPIRLLNQKKK
jgi:hypothetical protein